jgi:hypothetical protein
MIMAKHYLQISTFLFCLLVSNLGVSQTSKTNTPNYNTIEGLNIYPNPVSNGKLYISSSKNLSKYIEIYDVLGKKVYATSLFGKAMDISRLNIGVYIIKITENNNTVTRKFVVK